MSVGSMRKLTIEVDPSLREILERRLLESADMDYVSVRSVPSSRGLLAGGWQRHQRIRIDALVAVHAIDAMLDRLKTSIVKDARLEVMVSDIFGYPISWWYHSDEVHTESRELRWASELITM